jgi:hypothetical protein
MEKYSTSAARICRCSSARESAESRDTKVASADGFMVPLSRTTPASSLGFTPGVAGRHPRLLHERIRYEARGPAVSVEAKKVRARKMIRELRSLGCVELRPPAAVRPDQGGF